MLGDFCSGKREIWKGNLFLTTNQFGGNKICCADDNHNYISSMCEKAFSDSNLVLRSIGKISIFFKNLPQILQIHKNCNFSSIIVIF